MRLTTWDQGLRKGVSSDRQVLHLPRLSLLVLPSGQMVSDQSTHSSVVPWRWAPGSGTAAPAIPTCTTMRAEVPTVGDQDQGASADAFVTLTVVILVTASGPSEPS